MSQPQKMSDVALVKRLMLWIFIVSGIPTVVEYIPIPHEHLHLILLTGGMGCGILCAIFIGATVHPGPKNPHTTGRVATWSLALALGLLLGAYMLALRGPV